jgi:predicted pyridoxine 5'-phosphate oxidase superfamily flavin-nucleotide-binding protein
MTGGETLAPEALASIGDPGFFPSRAVRRVIVERETLWDTPLALALLIVLAGTEWIGRRLMRLL